jgi:hypothetical protein
MLSTGTFFNDDNGAFDDNSSRPKRMAKVSEKERIWAGPNMSLSDKIGAFLEAAPGGLHPLDIHLYAHDLILESCKRSTLADMRQAHDILYRLLLEKRVVKSLMISVDPFETIIYGWAKLAHSQSPEKMREILDLMGAEHLYDLEHFVGGEGEASKSSCQPTTATYNTVLRGLALVAKHNPSAAITAELLLDEMRDRSEVKGWSTKPNTRSFTHATQAHANAGKPESGDRAVHLLQAMQIMHEDEKVQYEQKHSRPYSLDDPSENLHQIVTPDAWIHSIVLTAIINSNTNNSAQQASDLLADLIRSGKKVDAFAFNTVIGGFARLAKTMSNPRKRFEYVLKAEKLATRFYEHHSDVCEIRGVEEMSEEEIQKHWSKQLSIAFNQVLNGWAGSDVKEAATRAEELFQRMVDSPLLIPCRVSFNTTMKAIARSRDPTKAEEILNTMIEAADQNPHETSLKPDYVSYCTAMSAWAKSSHEDKTGHSRRLLEKLISTYEAGDKALKPTVVAFTTVLNAAGHTVATDPDVSNEAYRIAMQTYDDLINDTFGVKVSPDSFLFAAMLKVIAAHTDPTSAERRQMLERVFDDACAAGQVSSFVINELRLATPDKEFLARLFRDPDLAKFLPSVNLLPGRWTRAVGNEPRLRDVDKKSEGRSEGRFRRR